MIDTTGSAQTRLRRLLRWRVDRPLTAEDAASRITAFVYGNILVLAALLALHPNDLTGPKAIAYVVGTGVSTFLAHVVAELAGGSVHAVEGETGAAGRLRLRHHLWDAVPIASSAITPAALMAVVLVGWVAPITGLILAISVTVLRLAGLGFVVARLRQKKASLRTILAGILLAVVCVVAALVKWWLTH
jgi:hypothetical protein